MWSLSVLLCMPSNLGEGVTPLLHCVVMTPLQTTVGNTSTLQKMREAAQEAGPRRGL